MQQHAIPQNVLSVEFQLVGTLTVRQFAYLAIGGTVSFLLIILPIFAFIKWPLALFFAGFSGALAFLPINDIGLDRWVIAFIRAINSPTKRVWRKDIKELAVFTSTTKRILGQGQNPPNAADRTKLDEYLATIRNTQPKSDLDIAEENYIKSLPFEEVSEITPAKVLFHPSEVTQLFGEVSVTPREEKRVVVENLIGPAPLQPVVKPVITVHMPDKNIYVRRVSTTTINRQLHSLSSLEETIILPILGEKTFEPSEEIVQGLQPLNQTSQGFKKEPLPIEAGPPLSNYVTVPPTSNTEFKKLGADFDNKPYHSENPGQASPQPVKLSWDDKIGLEQKLTKEADRASEELTKKHAQGVFTTIPAPSPPTPVRLPEGPVVIATTAPLPEGNLVMKKDTNENRPINIEQPPKPELLNKSETVVGTPPPAVGKMAPQASAVPNVLVGLIKEPAGLLLTDVVIIVKDGSDDPVRALKSNKVGQFAITTPLPNGTYQLELKKEGYEFDTYEITLTGEIFQPVEIRAKQ